MNVLILGANGMLGRALQRQFEADHVIAWDRNDLDITDSNAVFEHLPACEPELVINAAAYTDVEMAEEQEEVANRVNGLAVGYLAEACSRIGVPIVHISTDYVFSGDKEDGYKEDDIPEKPLNAYGRSKLLGEKKLQENTDKFWLIRTSWLFGPAGKNFVETMIKLGGEKQELNVVNDQHGSPTYTRDLAQAIFKMTRENASYGIYHLTNNGVTVWADFATEIFRIMGADVKVDNVSSSQFSTKAVRPQWSVLKNTKRPLLRSWQEALKDYINIRNVKNP